MSDPLTLGHPEVRNPPPLPDLEIYAPVRDELERAEEVFARELRSRHSYVQTLVEHVSGYRGKRLRPTLLLLAAKAVGGVGQDHIVLAAVVEMIHTATLIHDDVLDGADLRRHRSTVHAAWGTESSVLLGDFLFTHAFHLAASLGTTLACRLIGRSTNIVCEGELRQIDQRGNLQLTESEYLEIIGAKTAELCAVSCQLGTYRGGEEDASAQKLRRYGYKLGVAFQICDDLLDLTGQEQKTGKSLGSDVNQQKLTLPIIWLLREGPESAAREVRRIISGSSDRKCAEIRPILEEFEAMGYARGRAAALAESAAAELGSLPASPAKNVLIALTRFVIDRSA